MTNLPQRASSHVFQSFASSAALADALAERVSSALKARLARDKRAALAVSGGRTPVRFFQALSSRQMDWGRVDITLVDERWVDENAERSNARLVRSYLLQNAAIVAHWVPLVTNDREPEDGLAAVGARIAALPLPFAAVVLGMGEDGHTASFFPKGDRLATALDLAAPQFVEAMRAPAAAEPRITLTLPVLARADLIALHIEGEPKRRVFMQAEIPGPVEDMPIRAILQAAQQPVEVFWAP